MKISIYPSYRKNKKVGNPFINNLYDNLAEVADVQYVYGKNQQGLFHNLFKSKVYIMNWPENVIFDRFGFLQIFVFLAFLYILLLRRVKFVWFFHNITPHEGHNMYSRYIYGFMMRHSSLVVSLSKKGAEYLQGKTKATIKYYPHPFKAEMRKPFIEQKKWDFYIWGGINKYKGIVEFLTYLKESGNHDKYKILITGKCNDDAYDRQIRELLLPNIEYQNGYIDNDVLVRNMDSSRYVLFTYLANSVSSSGALMDSLEYGATVIGPHAGAFADSQEEGVCYTYKDYADILNIADGNNVIASSKVADYIHQNTWKEFSENLYNDIKSII